MIIQSIRLSETLDSIMDWSIFEATLQGAKPDKTQTSRGGRPPLSNLMMFKIVILQDLYGVANDETEYQINDRLSWKRFLGLSLSEKAPDGSTIWLFREMLTNTGIYEELFQLFNAKMAELGVITHKGKIADASFVNVPKQRNTRTENKVIKEGGCPEAWEDPGCANMLAQKDLDATWAKKSGELHYGYKDHILCDQDSKMITDFWVTPAHVHDSQVLQCLIDEKVLELWADSAYSSKELREWFAKHFPDVKLHINEKGYRNRPLTDEQQSNNREKSRVRARVEHVFGHMSGSMGGMFIRTIGQHRADCAIALKNLTYNISRFATLARLERAPKMA